MKKIKQALLVCFALILLAVIFLLLVLTGTLQLNGLNVKKYEVFGVDVSAYQGEIDWQTLAKQDISFAFIKATEGSSFVDKNFTFNFENAQKTGLAVGAYHFFSYDSPGKTQAESFISTVKAFDGMLPPVVDVEFYGDKEKNPPSRKEVECELKAMLDILEAHYKQKPIIYATEKSYKMFISGDYNEYDIWIRNVISKPRIFDKRDWTFWQWTNRKKLKGYQGKEKYIDVNVFNGSREEFNAYLNNNTYK